MAIRTIRLEGDEILHKKSKEVDKIDERVVELVNDMIETMHKYNGVGLAAVQVGVLKRIVVIDLYDDNGPIVLINPKIIKTKGEQEVEEGCLSFPNKFAKVVRPNEVTVKALDEKFGEEQAKAVGVDTYKVKRKLFILCAILTGGSVALSGTIGFVDLIAPHIVRKVFGSNHRYVVPMSFLFGGGFMVTTDLIARTIVAPMELPVGAVTALIGAPFFAYVYFKKGR